MPCVFYTVENYLLKLEVSHLTPWKPVLLMVVLFLQGLSATVCRALFRVLRPQGVSPGLLFQGLKSGPRQHTASPIRLLVMLLLE